MNHTYTINDIVNDILESFLDFEKSKRPQEKPKEKPQEKPQEQKTDDKIYSKYKVDAEKFLPKTNNKKQKIQTLKKQKESTLREIEIMKKSISKLRKYQKEIEDEIIALSKKDLLEDFFKQVNETEKAYQLNLSAIKEQFEKIFNSLNKDDNLQLSIDKTSDGFSLMIEGMGFSNEQKVKINTLKKLFKSLNI